MKATKDAVQKTTGATGATGTTAITATTATGGNEMKITLSLARVCGQASNRYYPDEQYISDRHQMAAAVARDHVCGSFSNHRRSRENFITADCIVMDCDNDHSDEPEDWIRPEDITTLLSDVSCVIVPSRNHMKEKAAKAGTKDGTSGGTVKAGSEGTAEKGAPTGTKSARPRFHVYFPISPINNEAECTDLKRRVQAAFPFFDANALDSARFIFGNPAITPDDIIWQEGRIGIQDYLNIMGENDEQTDRLAGEGCKTDWRTITEGNRNTTLSVFAARILKRYGNTKEAQEAFKTEMEKCDPPLEKEELRTIWRSALRFYGIISKSPDYVKPGDYNSVEWDEPIPFSQPLTDPFPVDALPPFLSSYVSAVAESTQTPVDMAGTVAMSILSACLQGKYRIQGKPDWIEPLNTYALVIAAPSERKSAVTHMMVRPLNEYKIRYNRDHGAEVESSRMAKKVLERRQRVLIEEFAKGKATQEDMDNIARQIADFIEVTPLQLYVDDVTPEKLVSVLATNNGKVAIISTEGGIFDTLAGTYSKVVNIDVMLKGYSGDTIRVDRIGRDSEYVTSPALTILLMAQPNVISAVLSNTTFRGRGLTARFLYCMPKSQVGSRRYYSVAVDETVARQYETKIKQLLEDESKDELITLSPEADKLIAAYAEELEPLLVTRYADIADWCGKLIGNTLRIAGLLCRAEVDRCFDFLDVNDPLVVSEDVMGRAIRLSRYFLSHAQAAYAVLPDNTVSIQGEKILKVIREKGLKEFNRREMMRMCKQYKTVADIQPVLDDLEDYGYIARLAEKPTSTGRPPLPRYLVNPRVHQIL